MPEWVPLTQNSGVDQFNGQRFGIYHDLHGRVYCIDVAEDAPEGVELTHWLKYPLPPRSAF
jgi:hypothetical protein